MWLDILLCVAYVFGAVFVIAGITVLVALIVNRRK